MLLSARTTDYLTRISSKLLYGTIVLLAVLGSMSYPLPNLTCIVTAIASLAGVALAKAYSDTVHEDMKLKRVTPWPELGKLIWKQGWVLGSAVVPVSFFGLAYFNVITQERAARWTTLLLLILLFFFGFLSRRLSGGGVAKSLAIGSLAAGIGWLVVVVEVWAKMLPKSGY